MDLDGLYTEFLQSDGVTTDTRTAGKNQIFFALKGEKFDGNEFVRQALEKGCRLVVTDAAAWKDEPKVLVAGSPLDTLQQLANHHRMRSPATVLGITGSNGKTTTKELIARVLAKKFKTLVTQGNLNNHIGVPLTLLRLKDEEMAVIEMGANHTGEIGALCRIADPDLGLITNIGKAHLEGFGSLDGVKKGKGELYDHLSSKGSAAFMNASDPVLSEMAQQRKLQTISYAVEKIAPVYGIPESSGQFASGKLFYDDRTFRITSSLTGSYNFQNIMAAIAVGIYFSIGIDQILDAVSSYLPDNNRSQLLEGKTTTLFLDAYNANPTSMVHAVQHFASGSEGPKMVILGDMLELGSQAEKEHIQLLSWLASQDFEQTILVGSTFFGLKSDGFPFLFFENIDACIRYLESNPPVGYYILLKGSRKIAVEKATKTLLNC
jgi:UDP-N-acetylmuramoyl-tripeptide--D-alanyl-D-alanine ligase